MHFEVDPHPKDLDPPVEMRRIRNPAFNSEENISITFKPLARKLLLHYPELLLREARSVISLNLLLY